MNLLQEVGKVGVFIFGLILFIASLYPVALFAMNVLVTPWLSFEFFMTVIGIELILGGLMVNKV